MMSDIEARLDETDQLWPGRGPERWVRAVAEEAGEVVGAFNKWHDGYLAKPRTKEDVLAEMAQLQACLLILARKLGTSADELLAMTDEFLAVKTEEVLEARRKHAEKA